MHGKKRDKKPTFVGSVSYYAIIYALTLFMMLVITGNWGGFQSLVRNFVKDQWAGIERRWYDWGPTPPASASDPASSTPVPSATASTDPFPVPSASTVAAPVPDTSAPIRYGCGSSYTCNCREEGSLCIRITDYGAREETETFVCTGGLYVQERELRVYRGYLYRNECRPRGMPPLKDCRLGQSCEAQGLKEGWPCAPNKDEVAMCHCGLVLNITTPQMREDVTRISCRPHPSDGQLPEAPCEPTPADPRAPISL